MAAQTFSIHEHAKDGNLAGVLNALACGTNVGARDPETNKTPLMEAASSPRANIELVRLLIQKGADVNAVAARQSRTVPREFFTDLSQKLDEETVGVSPKPELEKLKHFVDQAARRTLPAGEPPRVFRANVLSAAISSGNIEKIEMLLDAGADIRYELSHGYHALINVMYGRRIAKDPHLVPIIRMLIARGARLNTASSYGESALSVASREGRYDAIATLLEAGADPAPLQWTPLMREVALGSLDELRNGLKDGADLSERDSWSRTAWLISLSTGDVLKAKLLLAAGADREDRGRCGKTPLMYPITRGHTDMLRWLLSEGFPPDTVDEFDETPLIVAAGSGETECVKILIEAGANIHKVANSQAAIKSASNIEIVRLLVAAGADLNEISDEMRAALTGGQSDGRIEASIGDYQAAKHRRFGKSNPEKMNLPFWVAMVRSGTYAHAARERFSDLDAAAAIWCFQRFGKSITELPDGRIIEIAGEHEDYYDPDFCIYNDVTVHHGDGTFDIYGYPEACFPPTDFHTATLVEKYIYLLGNLGYQGSRNYAEIQVCRLDIESLEIERLTTCGDVPGWISHHKASYTSGRIRITGGKICGLVDGKETYQDNSAVYVLNLNNLEWSNEADSDSSAVLADPT